jgi:hypothetical protein
MLPWLCPPAWRSAGNASLPRARLVGPAGLRWRRGRRWGARLPGSTLPPELLLLLLDLMPGQDLLLELLLLDLLLLPDLLLLDLLLICVKRRH